MDWMLRGCGMGDVACTNSCRFAGCLVNGHAVEMRWLEIQQSQRDMSLPAAESATT